MAMEKDSMRRQKIENARPLRRNVRLNRRPPTTMTPDAPITTDHRHPFAGLAPFGVRSRTDRIWNVREDLYGRGDLRGFYDRRRRRFWDGRGEGSVDGAPADPQLDRDATDAPPARLEGTCLSNIDPNRWASNPRPATPSGGDPKFGSLPDHVPLQLRHGSDNVEREPTDAGARVDAVPEAHEVDAPPGELVERDHQVPDAPREAIESGNPHKADTTSTNVSHEAVEFGAAISAPTDGVIDVLPSDIPASLLSDLAELLDLSFGVLISR